MARTASPWFWGERNGWYVNKDGQRHFLGEHPEGAPPPRKVKNRWNPPQSILQAFHALMATPPEPPVPKMSPGEGLTVPEILDKYLEWCQKHRERRTFEWYQDHIQNFLNSLKDAATMPASDLRPF